MAFLRDRFGLGLTLFPGFLKALLDSSSLSAVRSASMSTKAFQMLGIHASDLDVKKIKEALCGDIQWVRRNVAIVALVVTDAVLKLKGTGQGKELDLRRSSLTGSLRRPRPLSVGGARQTCAPGTAMLCMRVASPQSVKSCS